MAIGMQSELLNYLVERGVEPGERLPSIQALAGELGISSSKLREQLEVARSLELVEIRPKTGMRSLKYSFLPCLRMSLQFAISKDPALFEAFGVLRNHLEVSFWHEAVELLEPQDKQKLQSLVDEAWSQLRGSPVQIPHREHRELHLTIFARIENVFVRDILEAYWEAYELVGLNVYSDYAYLEQVWRYHSEMVAAIQEGRYEDGHRALIEHIGILQHRPEMDRFRPRSARTQPAPTASEGTTEIYR